MEHNPILVIGAGPAGLEAARGAADLGYPTILVEKTGGLGGTPIQSSYAALTPDLEDAETAMQRMIDAIEGDPLIDVRTGTTIEAVSGEAPELSVTLKGPDGEDTVEAGAAIVCTGWTARRSAYRA